MGIRSFDSTSSKKGQTAKGPCSARRPVIEYGRCSLCGSCVELAPEIFRINEDTGYIDVVDLDYYDPDLVEEAMKYCPEDCIRWDDDSDD